MYQLQRIALTNVIFNPRQPRTDATATDLASLAASMGSADEPMLAQLPVVFPIGNGQFMVQAGERRIRSALLIGVTTLHVLVLTTRSTPIERHRLSMLENLHREDLRTLDEAIAFKTYYLHQNAVALGQQEIADRRMEEGADPLDVLQSLQMVLEEHGWQRLKPAMTYEVCLSALGITVNKSVLMRRLRVLNLEIDVIKRIQGFAELTEAAIRSIGKLAVDDQRLLLDALGETPEIVKNIRRICATVAKKTYTVREAIAEARGQVYLEPAADDTSRDAAGTAGSAQSGPNAGPREHHTADSTADNSQLDEQLEPFAMQLLDIATSIDTALLSLETVVGGTRMYQGQTGMWSDTVREAITLIQTTLAGWDVS